MKRLAKVEYINWMVRLLPVLLIPLIYIVLYKIYIPRANEFGCFDDCNNFMGGYFLLHGKKLFSEIFFNHAPGMAYISLYIQLFFDPINLSELILRHRQFVIAFGLIFNLALLLRFKLKAVGFVIWYELTKFYLFGDRFLGEALVVYPLVYMVGLIWEISNKKPLKTFDYLVSAFFVWFVIFSREPYIPLALFLFILLIVQKDNNKARKFASLLLVFLSISTLLYHNISDFIFNVFTVNVSNIAYENSSTNVFGLGIFQSFLYPFWILATGEQSILRSILKILSLLFIAGNYFLIRNKKYKVLIYLWIILGLSNLRPVTPGQMFYSTYHIIIWYGLFLFLSFCILMETNMKKLYRIILICLYIFSLVFFLSSNKFYLNDKVDPHTSFITNYGGPLQVGNVVASLSSGKDTLFLDGFDDIIYWVSQKESPYKYSWYTSLMPNYKIYTDSRILMFKKNLPDFYYGSCPKEIYDSRLLPKDIRHEYQQLYSRGKPTCLYVRKVKIPNISSESWKRAKDFYYELP